MLALLTGAIENVQDELFVYCIKSLPEPFSICALALVSEPLIWHALAELRDGDSPLPPFINGELWPWWYLEILAFIPQRFLLPPKEQLLEEEPGDKFGRR